MFEVAIKSHKSPQLGGDTNLSIESVESLAAFAQRERLIAGFHRRFDRLEQEVAFHRPVDDKNLAALHAICADRDFDFAAAGQSDYRTPLGRVLTLTTADPVLNFGFPRLPWAVKNHAVENMAGAIVGQLFGAFSPEDSIVEIKRTLEWAQRQELAPVDAITYAAAANRIAVEFLQQAIAKIPDLNKVLLDPEHRYLEKIYNTEVIDLFIGHGLKALDGGYNYQERGPFASPEGLKLVARLKIADVVLPCLSSVERGLVEAALVRQMKPWFAECVGRRELFQLQNGCEPSDPVEALFFEHLCTLSDRSMLEFMEVARQCGYFDRENVGGELPYTVCEGFYPSLNQQFLEDRPYPVQTFRFLASQGVRFDNDCLLFLDDVDGQLEHALAAAPTAGAAREFLMDQRRRVGLMTHLVRCRIDHREN